MRLPRWSLALVALTVGLAACGGTEAQEAAPKTGSSDPAGSAASTASTLSEANPPSTGSTTTDPPDPTSATTAASTAPTEGDTDPSVTTSTTDGSEATGGTSGPGGPIVIRLKLDRRVSDPATEGFADVVKQVLTDERGWTGAGFRFVFDDDDFDYTVVLAEGSEVDALCLPYDTFGRFSCQIGPVVALNAERWRTAVDSWPATLDDYRAMLVNHEVGHLLGQHHPASRCPAGGEPSPVMAQQSSGVAPCRANPWPLPWEIRCAAQGVEPLAPPFERDIVLTCGPGGPITSG